jgi:hypothetical protein
VIDESSYVHPRGRTRRGIAASTFGAFTDFEGPIHGPPLNAAATMSVCDLHVSEQVPGEIDPAPLVRGALAGPLEGPLRVPECWSLMTNRTRSVRAA